MRIVLTTINVLQQITCLVQEMLPDGTDKMVLVN